MDREGEVRKLVNLLGSEETRKDPVGLLGTKAFYVPHLWITGNRLLSVSKTSTEFNRRFKQLLIKEGVDARDLRWNSLEAMVPASGRLLRKGPHFVLQQYLKLVLRS